MERLNKEGQKNDAPHPITSDSRDFLQPSLQTMPKVGITSALQEKQALNNTSDSRPALLVVEDNSDLQEYLQLILADSYQLSFAENGRQALDLIRQNPTTNIRLILSDLMMPVMDGYQLLDELKSNDTTSHIPVIMLTARADVNDKLKALRQGTRPQKQAI